MPGTHEPSHLHESTIKGGFDALAIEGEEDEHS